MKPHVLGIDDSPFIKGRTHEVPVVGVMMEGNHLVEGIAISSFPVDGAGATEYLSDWIRKLRWHASLQAIVLGGITIAGLGIVDITLLAQLTGVPVISVTRNDTAKSELKAALLAAGLTDRVAVLDYTPAAFQHRSGIFVAFAGTEKGRAEQIVSATLLKASLPEPLRIAHLIGTALVRGQSKGRV